MSAIGCASWPHGERGPIIAFGYSDGEDSSVYALDVRSARVPEIAISSEIEIHPGFRWKVAVGDLFNDGNMDVVINDLDGGPMILKNHGVAGRHWISHGPPENGRSQQDTGLSKRNEIAGSVLPPTASPLPSPRSVAPRWRRTSLCVLPDPLPATGREPWRSSAQDIPDLPMTR